MIDIYLMQSTFGFIYVRLEIKIMDKEGVFLRRVAFNWEIIMNCIIQFLFLFIWISNLSACGMRRQWKSPEYRLYVLQT